MIYLNIKIHTLFLLTLFVMTLLTSCDNPISPDAQGQSQDFSIAYIKRLPELDYIWGISNATRDGWPSIGELVTWRGAIKSGSSKSQSVSYTWLLDGQEVDSGNIRIDAGSNAYVEVNRQWDFQRHELDLVIRFDRDGQNVSKSLKIYTDALSVKFYVEESVYAAFQNKYSQFFKRSFASFDETAQEWIRFWNLMYEKAVYPETPKGVLDRVRLDEIVIVNDDALPLAPQSHAEAQPNQKDRTTDYQIGLPKKYIENYLSPEYFKVVLHELGHVRYLIDLYGLDVFDDRDSVLIKEEGRLITKSKYLPRQYGGAVVRTPERGLMNREIVDYGIDSLLSRYSAMALNLIVGQRARYGNYNAPENIGSFLNDLPQENVMTIRDQNGLALGGAKVELYR
ncbi:MAG: hypothetical protein ACE5IR_21465, partial [bacterium]